MHCSARSTHRWVLINFYLWLSVISLITDKADAQRTFSCTSIEFCKDGIDIDPRIETRTQRVSNFYKVVYCLGPYFQYKRCSPF